MAEVVKLTVEQRDMVQKNLALATYVAKKYLSKTDYIRNQDIIQEAVYAMMKATPKYNPEHAKFSTYMYPTIDGHLKRFVGYRDRIIPIPHQKHLKPETQARAENAKSIFSLDKEVQHNRGNSGDTVTLMDILPNEVEIESKIVNRLVISDAIKSLTWREKVVITYRYYFDLNQTHIGQLMLLSQVHCHRLEKKALKNMRNFLGGI